MWVFLFFRWELIAIHKVPTLGDVTADIEKHGIGFMRLEKPHTGLSRCGVFFCHRDEGQVYLFPSR